MHLERCHSCASQQHLDTLCNNVTWVSASLVIASPPAQRFQCNSIRFSCLIGYDLGIATGLLANLHAIGPGFDPSTANFFIRCLTFFQFFVQLIPYHYYINYITYAVPLLSSFKIFSPCHSSVLHSDADFFCVFYGISP